jgi:hypothetical protein
MYDEHLFPILQSSYFFNAFCPSAIKKNFSDSNLFVINEVFLNIIRLLLYFFIIRSSSPQTKSPGGSSSGVEKDFDSKSGTSKDHPSVSFVI